MRREGRRGHAGGTLKVEKGDERDLCRRCWKVHQVPPSWLETGIKAQESGAGFWELSHKLGVAPRVALAVKTQFPSRRREERGCGPVTGKDRASCQSGGADAAGEEEDGMNQESSTDMYTLPCVK